MIRSGFAERALNAMAWLSLSSPHVMYQFDVEFLAPVVSCLMTDEAGCDCTV